MTHILSESRRDGTEGKTSRLEPVWVLARVGFLAAASLVILALASWSVLAVYFSNIPDQRLRAAAATSFGAGTVAAFLFLPDRWRTVRWFLAAFLTILLWWRNIPGSHDRDWKVDVAVLPTVSFHEGGRRATIQGIRNFDHRGTDDFTARYDTRTYDLDDLETMDLVLSDWGLGDVVHTMLSFGFRGGGYLAVSVETRLERGEPQSGLRGLFKQYELIYVLADERDIIRLRTNVRRENVYVYPTTTSPAEARIVLSDILETVNSIAAEPRFYNTITHNCTTGMLPHLQKARRIDTCDVRFLLNGQTVERAYALGSIRTQGSLTDTRRLHHVNRYVANSSDAADFSLRIRPHLRNR